MAGIPEYERLDAIGLATLIARREVTALEVLEETIAQAEKFNTAINAVILKLYDQARTVAKAPLPEGPLAGVPFLLKDLGVLMAGTPTTGSSKLFADFIADHDSTIVARYRAAGLNIFGKTATAELGLACSTEPAMYGPCRNPWNLAYSAGGSSGGSAAAVAARILPVAHANDGGGSIRMPASACGLFGLKSTQGRNPSGPEVGEDWGGLIVNHCVSISVRDSATLLDATSAPDVGDPYWVPPPVGTFLDEVGLAPRILRIALCINPWNGEPVDLECRQAAEDAAKLCESMGHHVTIARPEFDVASFEAAFLVIATTNVHAALAARSAAVGKTLEATDVEPLAWPWVQRGESLMASDYAAAVTTVYRTGRAVARFFSDHDILLTPTMCSPPTELGVQSLSNPDPDAFLVATKRSIGFTSLFNATGNPAVSVPLHWTASGLPVGVQFVAPFGDEATLFRLAAQLEIARPWKDRRPPLIVIRPHGAA